MGTHAPWVIMIVALAVGPHSDLRLASGVGPGPSSGPVPRASPRLAPTLGLSCFIRFWLAWSSPLFHMRTCIPCCSGLCLPLQLNSQGSEYVMDNSSSFLLPTGRIPGGPPQEIYTVVDISYFLFGCLVPHQLHGGLVCSRFWFGHTVPAASVEHTFFLLLPSPCSMKEHFMQYD